MSYILDALRRADAERERGGVPSLHTQQQGALPGDDDGPQAPRLLLTVIIVLVLALGSLVAWNLWGGRDSSARATAQTGVAGAPPAVATTAPAALPPAPALPPPTVATTPPASPPETSSATTTAAADTPDARRRLLAAAASMKAERRGGHRQAAAPAGATHAASGSATPSSGQLPDALRRELPALAFGGASFSKDPASRMVIFNGRVFHEGDTIAPDLMLQQIRNKAAVFVYKGYVYEVAF